MFHGAPLRLALVLGAVLLTIGGCGFHKNASAPHKDQKRDNDANLSPQLLAARREWARERDEDAGRDKDRDRDKDKDHDRRNKDADKGPEPFDEPKEFQEFYAMKRMPVGAATLPIERFFAAAAWNKNMPQFSSSLGTVLPPQSAFSANNTNVSNWTYLGPGNIGGRVRSLLIDPTNPSTMYAGGVAGGVWKTTNGGGNWTSVGGALPNLAISSMAMDPKNSSTIYAGTGEGYFNIDAVRGAGIFVTNDGGGSWSQLGSTSNDSDFYYVNKIVVSPVNSSRIYAATGTGVFQSTNSGGSWTQVVTSSSNSDSDNGCFDLAMRSDNQTDDYIVASCGTFAQASIWLNKAASTNPSWTQVFTNSNMALTSLAISPANQNRMYALSASLPSGNFQYGLWAVLASTNGGSTWTTVYTNSGSNALANLLLTNAFAAACESTVINQGWYDNVLAVDPSSPSGGPDILWAGGIDLFRSNNGGATWGEASYWWASGSNYSHADQHAITFLPTDDGKTMFIGSDGGVSQATNRLAATSTSICSANSSVSFNILNNNLGITQFYDGAVFPDGNTFFGGTQDNGTNLGTVGGGSNNWTQIMGGDGGYVAVNPSNTSILYGEFTGLSIQKSTNGGNIFNDATTGISDSGFLFIAPFTMDPNNPQQLWTGGSDIWTTSNGASSWTKAGTVPNASVSAIAVAPGNSNKVAVGTGSFSSTPGTVSVTSNALSANPSWTTSTPSGSCDYISWLAYDPNNSQNLYATCSNFGSSHIFKSANGGSSWASIDGSGSTGIPDIPVMSIVVNPSNSQMLFIGTDSGVYSSTTGGTNWSVETSGFADVPIDALKLVTISGNNFLYAFTHGLGVWSAPVQTGGVCSYTLSSDQAVPAAGSTTPGTVTVTTQTGCSWSAVSNTTNPAWLTVTNGSGTGSGSFNWSAAANTGAARSGTVTVSGESGTATFTANQAAQTYTISGVVTLGGVAGAGVSGVTITLNGSATGTTTTNSAGYSFTETAGGNYTVTPSISGTNCTIASQTFNNLSANSTANFTAPNVTFATNPASLNVSVNNTGPVTAPVSWCWAPGTSIPVSVDSPQNAGQPTQYVWSSWSDTGAQSHSANVPASGTVTFTATFNPQYQLSVTPSPSGAGTVAANPTSASGYYAPGAAVQLTASATAPFTFLNWSGDQNTTINPLPVTMNAPVNLTANFSSSSPVVVTTVPAGLSVIVDGVTGTSPQSFTWISGTNHTIAAPAPTLSGGVSDIFSNWSDGGAQSHSVTAPASPVLYTATFTTNYQLTPAAVPAVGGTITASPASANGFYASGASVQLTATPNAGYYFTGWSGALTGTANPQPVAMTAVTSVTANFAPLTPITVTTAPSGLAVIVDGATLTSPQSFEWVPGSQHTLNLTSPQQGMGTQSAFSNWSDGGAQSHSVTTPASATAYIATFSQQFLLTTGATPSTGGSVAASPASATGYYASGTTVQLTATPSPNYQFSGWSGDLSGSVNPQSLTMNAPHTVMATFAQPVPITVTSQPRGLTIVVDGNTITTPQTFNWFPGSNHSVNATSPEGAGGTRYVFDNWSDNGAQSHSVTVTSSGATYTAAYDTQYLLTAAAMPSAGGSLSIAPPAPGGDGYYLSGTLVQLTASTTAGFRFTGWSGDLSGTADPAVLTMSAPHTATANFLSTAGITVTSNPAGLQLIVDGSTITTPQSFTWAPGGNHTLSLVSPQGTGGAIQVFSAWSDGGALSHSVTAPSSLTTYTATFTTNYLLTAAAAPTIGGSVAASPSSANGYYATGAGVQLTATANQGYQFAGWSGDLTGNTNPQTINMTAAHTVTANFTALSGFTVNTVPSGLQIMVDGATLTAPQTFQWATGSIHTLNVTSPQATGVGSRAAFASWSDAGAQSHSITAPPLAATYTATFTPQYLLTFSASPSVGGVVAPNLSSPDGYYNAGTQVQLTAQPAANYQFTSWSGDLSGAANPQAIAMSAPHSVVANFTAPGSFTVATAPAGRSVVVDGATVTAPQSFSWLPGSIHSLSVTSPQSANPRYVFTSWSDNGAAAHNITAPAAAATYTATFNTQYLLTTAVSPSGAGTATATPSSIDGYYNVGTPVQLLAAANSGFTFTGWSGDLTGSGNPQSITMNAAHSVTAGFSANVASCSIALTPNAASVPPTGTSTVETCPNNSGQPNCGVLPEAPLSFTVTPSAACGPWTAVSSNPALLGLAAGASGSGAGTVSYTLLDNTHTGSQNYSITVTSGAASATYPVTQAGSGDSSVYRQILALYEQLLGRDPDAAGFAFWSGSGAGALGSMADAFLTSPEAYNTDFAVMAAYQAATGTAPTYPQFTTAVTNIRAGLQTVPGLFSSLTGSGYSAANLYQNLLGRSPSAGEISSANQAGLASAFQTLIGYPGAETPIAAPNNEFQSTGTFQTTIAADHTNSLYVQMLFYVILGRNADPAGLAFWLGIANSGGPGILFQGNAGFNTRIQILGPGAPNQGFIGSPEFQGLFSN